MRISGLSISDCATTSSTAYDSGRSAELPVWKLTPFSTTVGRRGGAPGAAGTRSSGKSSGQPYASTGVCGGVLGQRSMLSGTPSPSLSRVTGQPVASTGVPGGVLGHLSIPSGTPSGSESPRQPTASTTAPAGGLGQWSTARGTPSLSESMGHPAASTFAPAGVLGHLSRPS